MNEKNQKSNYIWNAIAGIINASEAVILLVIITRTNGIFDAGILTISFAIANLLVNIGKFGMRGYQVTDVRDQYSFNTYFTSRLVTTITMLAVVILYLTYGIQCKQYNLDKVGIIFFICTIFATEAFEDIFAGLFQKIGRLDIGGVIFSVRWLIIITVMGTILINRKNLLTASIAGMITSIVCSTVLIIYSYKKICRKPLRIDFHDVISLLRSCIPLFLTSFLQFYIINASKYAIDRFYTEDIQAYYGFVAMPIFVVGLLNSFLYQPILVQLALRWEKGDIRGVIRQVWIQLSVTVAITVICLAGASIVGIPVLSYLYHTDLNAYKKELLILLLGGGFLAVIGFATVLLTIMRRQNWILYAYFFASVLALIFTNKMVKTYATIGAACAFLITVSVLSILLVLIVLYMCIKGLRLER